LEPRPAGEADDAQCVGFLVLKSDAVMISLLSDALRRRCTNDGTDLTNDVYTFKVIIDYLAIDALSNMLPIK
jgi:hypothetical protein